MVASLPIRISIVFKLNLHFGSIPNDCKLFISIISEHNWFVNSDMVVYVWGISTEDPSKITLRIC